MDEQRGSTTRGFGLSSLVDHDIVRVLAPEAERLGYAAFWVNDLPNASGLASLGVAASAAPDIELGVGVLAVDRWDAAGVSAEIERAGIDPRRLTIGIGAGQLVRGARAAVAEAAAGLRTIGARRVVVGSLGPSMTRLGGSDSAGVLLNWVTPEAARTLAEVARDGGAGAPVWTAAYTRVAADPAAEERLDAECRAYESYDAYARHFERFGLRARDTATLGDRDADGRWLGAFEGIVDHVVVRAIAAADTADAYLDVLRAAAPAGGDDRR